MTINHQENSRGKKDSKRPALSRKRSSWKGLPPIYETDEESGEIPFDLKNRAEFRDAKVVNADYEGQIERSKQSNTVLGGGNFRAMNSLGKLPAKHTCLKPGRRETCNNIARQFGCVPPGSSHAVACGINQTVFPDFFPRGMPVHCSKNALPEASKGLYMKTMEANIELKYIRNCYETSVSTNTSNSSWKHQGWMQFFG